MNIYLHGKDFLAIKNEIKNHIDECDQLNSHIDEMKYSLSLDKRVDYGKGNLSDTSVYNMKRKEWAGELKNKYVYNCSNSIVKNAHNQPLKYLFKYFNIQKDEETVENLESMLNRFSAVEEGKFFLKRKRDELLSSIKGSLSSLALYFDERRVVSELGFKKTDLSNIYFPVYTFQYVSPGGNSSTKLDIRLDLNQIENLMHHISEDIKFKKTIAGQRSLMTSRLRESIKDRDGYACKICGISTSDEMTLLLEIDHIIPLSKGGTTIESNLQTLCWKCNRSKGSKIL